MAVICFFSQMAPFSKATVPRGCPTTLLSFKLISLSVFESGNQNVDGQTDVRVISNLLKEVTSTIT